LKSKSKFKNISNQFFSKAKNPILIENLSEDEFIEEKKEEIIYNNVKEF